MEGFFALDKQTNKTKQNTQNKTPNKHKNPQASSAQQLPQAGA